MPQRTTLTAIPGEVLNAQRNFGPLAESHALAAYLMQTMCQNELFGDSSLQATSLAGTRVLELGSPKN